MRLRPTPRGLVAGAVAAPWLVWAVVRVLGLERGHPLVAVIAFTPYAAATAPLPVLLALALRRRAVAAVAAAAALALAAVVLPRALDGPADAPANARGPVLVVMTINLYVGRADTAAVVRLARERRVDVLSLQEAGPEALARLDAAGIRKLLPHRVGRGEAGTLSSAVLARRPLRVVPGSGPVAPEAALHVPGAPPLRVKAVHPRPPVSEAQERDWRRTLRALPGPRAGAALRILAGDFNATLDHRELRRVLDRGYVDAADATGDGLAMTWPVRRRRPPLAIDHVLVPPGVMVRRVSVHRIGGGDHRAVIAELVLPRMVGVER